MIRKVILFLTLVCCATAAIDNCKQGGEYCLNHWDCCSNTCLSYLYQCSKIQKPQSADDVQMTPALFAQPGIPNVKPETASLEALLQIVFSPLKAIATIGRETNEINSRFGEFENEEVTNPTTEGPTTECLEIGEKCYRHEECCSTRCHGFLHQCVT